MEATQFSVMNVAYPNISIFVFPFN